MLQDDAKWLLFFLTCTAAMSTAYYYVVIEGVDAWLAALIIFCMVGLVCRLFVFPSR
ncbi:MAG: hypothetical protein WBX26_14260 [Candidatus Cybelea sp.]